MSGLPGLLHYENDFLADDIPAAPRRALPRGESVHHMHKVYSGQHEVSQDADPALKLVRQGWIYKFCGVGVNHWSGAFIVQI